MPEIIPIIFKTASRDNNANYHNNTHNHIDVIC